jgi:serine protease
MRFVTTTMLAALGLGVLCAAPAAAQYVPGEVIVRYDDGAVEREPDIAGAETLPGGAQRAEIVDGESVAETLAELRSDPRVEYAQPNYLARAAAFFPNDPGAGGPGEWHALQWNFYGPAGVNAPDAWEIARALGAPGGRGAVVAVLDSGVAYENRGRYRRAPDLHSSRFVRGWDFVDGDAHPNDENGHGTHVTGTIAQGTNNGTGVTGLAYGVKIMPVRVLDEQGVGDEVDIARGIRFAARKGADVINLSLEFPTNAVTASSQIPEIASALRYAHARGTVVVGASGNSGDARVAYPARASHVIAVGATTVHACRADYSNTGSGLDLVAPGGGEDYTAGPGESPPDNARDAESCDVGRSSGARDIYQQTFTNDLRSFGLPGGYEGTSMAAPHVSAVAALVIATRRAGANPSPAVIERRLKATARDLGPDGVDRRYGAGLLNAAAALGAP